MVVAAVAGKKVVGRVVEKQVATGEGTVADDVAAVGCRLVQQADGNACKPAL